VLQDTIECVRAYGQNQEESGRITQLLFVKHHVGHLRIIRGTNITSSEELIPPQISDEEVLRRFESIQAVPPCQTDSFSILFLETGLARLANVVAPSSAVICNPIPPFIVAYLDTDGGSLLFTNLEKGKKQGLRQYLAAFDTCMAEFWTKIPRWMKKQRRGYLRPEAV
jgi:hypothetical protein